jgi:DNA-binding transcriptional regulator PaaX
MSEITDQILLHLYDCVDYGFSYNMKRRLWIIKYFNHGKSKINQKEIKNSIRELSKLKFIKKKENYDGSVLISLNEKGRLRALNLSFKRFYNRKEKWDGKWRMIAFDIPDASRKGRNALRYRMRLGGFYELQESLFLYPYDCEREIKSFVELFKLEKYVRFALIDYIDNEKEIKLKMGIS